MTIQPIIKVVKGMAAVSPVSFYIGLLLIMAGGMDYLTYRPFNPIVFLLATINLGLSYLHYHVKTR